MTKPLSLGDKTSILVRKYRWFVLVAWLWAVSAQAASVQFIPNLAHLTRFKHAWLGTVVQTESPRTAVDLTIVFDASAVQVKSVKFSGQLNGCLQVWHVEDIAHVQLNSTQTRGELRVAIACPTARKSMTFAVEFDLAPGTKFPEAGLHCQSRVWVPKCTIDEDAELCLTLEGVVQIDG